MPKEIDGITIRGTSKPKFQSVPKCLPVLRLILYLFNYNIRMSVQFTIHFIGVLWLVHNFKD